MIIGKEVLIKHTQEIDKWYKNCFQGRFKQNSVEFSGKNTTIFDCCVVKTLVGMNPKAVYSSAERRAPRKIEQADCPEKI